MAGTGTGLRGYAGIAFQINAAGTQTTSVHWLPLISESLAETMTPVEGSGMEQSFAEPISYEGGREVAGDLSVELETDACGALFHAVMGLNSRVTAGDFKRYKFTHTGSQYGYGGDTTSPLQPFTVLLGRDIGTSKAFQYRVCNANQLTLDINHGELAKATIGVVATKCVLDQSEETPSYNAPDEAQRLAWTVSSISLAGAGINKASAIQFQIMNNLESVTAIDVTSTFPRQIRRNGFFQVRASGTLIFEDETQLAQFRARSENELKVTMTTPNSQVIMIACPKFVFDSFNANIAGPGQIEASFAGRGHYDSTTGSIVIDMYKLTAMGTDWTRYGKQ